MSDLDTKKPEVKKLVIPSVFGAKKVFDPPTKSARLPLTSKVNTDPFAKK